MEEDFYFVELYELYKNLLTENQRTAFHSHYLLDLSLAEIAENMGVGRQSVYETIKVVKNRLNELENGLGLYKKANELKQIAKDTTDKKTAEEILSLLGE